MNDVLEPMRVAERTVKLRPLKPAGATAAVLSWACTEVGLPRNRSENDAAVAVLKIQLFIGIPFMGAQWVGAPLNVMTEQRSGQLCAHAGSPGLEGMRGQAFRCLNRT